MYERKTCQRAKAHKKGSAPTPKKKGIESFIGYDPSRDISEISHIDASPEDILEQLRNDIDFDDLADYYDYYPDAEL